MFWFSLFLLAVGFMILLFGLGFALRLLAYQVRGVNMGWSTIVLLALLGAFATTLGLFIIASYFPVVFG